MTRYAVDQLREITYFEFSIHEGIMEQGASVAFLESIKVAMEIIAPVAGRIKTINDSLPQHLEMLNQFPESSGWLCQIEVETFLPEEFMNEEQYVALITKARR